MSDYEDEMDVDAPKDVQFSSDNASGKKRTAADLPIEAQDNLPWYVCYLFGQHPLLITGQGREISTEQPGRCVRPPRHPRYHQPIRGYKCLSTCADREQ